MLQNSNSTLSIDPWKYKPWWCQPWSILLTGISIITGSWLLFHRLWLTVLVSVPILAWMVFFLVVWPPLMAEYLTQVQEGNEEKERE
jgi:hypothetical protein